MEERKEVNILLWTGAKEEGKCSLEKNYRGGKRKEGKTKTNLEI